MYKSHTFESVYEAEYVLKILLKHLNFFGKIHSGDSLMKRAFTAQFLFLKGY